MPDERRGRRKKQYDPSRGDGGGPRALWSGTISFGLVSVHVDLLPGTRPGRSSLRMLGPDGTPLRRQYVCPAEDDRPLQSGELVRGYQTEDGEMIVVEDDELRELDPERSRDISLSSFVPRDAIAPEYFQRSYFLAPTREGSAKAYFLLARVMEERGVAGLATFVMRGHEYLAAIVAEGGVLRAETLRFAGELRDPESVDTGDAEPKSSDVKALRKAIKACAADDIDESELRDGQTQKLMALVEGKRERGEDIETTEEADEGGEAEVIDLMQELKKRLGAEPARPKRKRKRGGRGKKKYEDGSMTEMTKDELYQRAQELDIGGRSKMTKEELIEAIRSAG